MKKGVILKKLISDHNPDIYILVKGLSSHGVAVDMFLLSDNLEKDRRIRGAILPIASLLKNFRVIHPYSPEMDLVRSLFRLPAIPS